MQKINFQTFFLVKIFKEKKVEKIKEELNLFEVL